MSGGSFTEQPATDMDLDAAIEQVKNDYFDALDEYAIRVDAMTSEERQAVEEDLDAAGSAIIEEDIDAAAQHIADALEVMGVAS